jgi:hypothetical protein
VRIHACVQPEFRRPCGIAARRIGDIVEHVRGSVFAWCCFFTWEPAVFKILVDTCVWLDLAKDTAQVPLIAALEALIERKVISLIVPRLVVDEFRRHQERIGRESMQSLRGVLRRVKDAVEEFGDPKQRRLVLRHLDDMSQRMPIKGGAAVSNLNRIDQLLSKAPKIDPSDRILLRASHRAIESKAPFHRNVNSMADAIIIETYADELQSKGAGLRYAFVTHNTKDFSAPNADVRKPHPDLASLFSKIRSLYFIKLGDALRRADASAVRDVMFEHSFDQEPRGLTEILEAIDLLLDQVWYNRHQNRLIKIERGQIKLVDQLRRHSGAPNSPIEKSVWHLAQAAAAKVEKERGLDNLGPWSDFEWGMINGKLSALRWVLGDEWDMLDT